MKANDRIISLSRCNSPGHYELAIEWRGKTRKITVTDMPLVDEYKSSERGSRAEAIAANRLVNFAKHTLSLK